MISTFTAFFDSNVFFGARLRSIIMTLAQTNAFRARWSEDVHREWMQAVIKRRPELTLHDLESTRRQIDAAVLDCLVTGYEGLTTSLNLPDPKDCHVLAAAIVAKSSAIVTFNLKHFPDEALRPYGIHAVHPDKFLLDIDGLTNEALFRAVEADRKHYANPPLALDDYLNDLRAAGVPETANHIKKLSVLVEPRDGDAKGDSSH
jgi:predicted nucleic acid-binding protein